MYDFIEEFDSLKKLNGMDGLFLISKGGEVVWSWQSSGIQMDVRTMRLVEMTKILIPIMLNMPDVGVQRSLFQFDYNKEIISMYFTNIGDNAFIGAILGKNFDYINVTVEVNRVAFIVGKKLARENVSETEMKEYLVEVTKLASLSISSTMNQFSRIKKERVYTNGAD